MNKFLHSAAEIYDQAKRAIDKMSIPDNWDELRMIDVKYILEDENKEVIYTVTFQPFFDAGDRKFDHWGHIKTEMYISEIKGY